MQYLYREHGEYIYKQSILSGVPAENRLLIGHQTPFVNEQLLFYQYVHYNRNVNFNTKHLCNQ
jgi:hypothetical protein